MEKIKKSSVASTYLRATTTSAARPHHDNSQPHLYSTAPHHISPSATRTGTFCAVAYGPHLASDSDEHFSEAEQCAKGTTRITSGAPDISPFATGPQSILSNFFYCWMRTRNKTWRRVGTVQIPKYAGWRIFMWQLTAARGDVPRGGIVAHAAHPSHPSAVTIHEGRGARGPAGRQDQDHHRRFYSQGPSRWLPHHCRARRPHRTAPSSGSISPSRIAEKRGGKKENGRTKSARELPRPAHMADGGGYHNNRPTSDRPASSGRIFRVHARRRGRMRRTP